MKFVFAALLTVSLSHFQLAHSQQPDPLSEAKAAAKNGDIEANLALGYAHHQGYGVEKDPNKALAYYKFASDGGNNLAKMYIGELYCDGVIDNKDCKTGHKLLLEAREAGVTNANLALGYNFSSGRGVDVNIPLALDAYSAGMDAGDPYAAFNMLFLFLRDQAAASDINLAFKAAEFAAKEGVQNAGPVSEQLFEKYPERKKKYDQQKLAETKTIAEQSGSADDWYNHYLRVKKTTHYEVSYETGLQALKKSGEAGHFDAQKSLGVTYYRGNYVPQDVNYARRMLHAAKKQDQAKSDNGEVDFLYGKMLLTYFDDPADKKQGMDSLKLGADRGSKQAAFLLANIFMEGRVVPQDLGAALKYANRAQELGHFGGGRMIYTVQNWDELRTESDAFMKENFGKSSATESE